MNAEARYSIPSFACRSGLTPFIGTGPFIGTALFVGIFACFATDASAQGTRWSGVQPNPGFASYPNGPYPSSAGPNNNNIGTNGVAPNGAGRLDPRLAAVPNTILSNPPGIPVASNKPTGDGSSPLETDGKPSARSLLQMFHDGGLMMYPIALCSFALMVFSFERLIHLRRGRVIPRPFVNRLIEQIQQQQVDRDEAIELCDKNPNPMSRIMIAALKRYGRQAVEVEQAVLDAGERESNQLRRYMRLLSAISNVSPLLGLLGTVLGMMQSFNDISSSQAMGRPEMLAGGISQALLTTAAGLLVAIPAYVMYIYFVGHIDRLIVEMDQHAQRLIDVISAEGLQESDTGRSRNRSRKAA